MGVNEEIKEELINLVDRYDEGHNHVNLHLNRDQGHPDFSCYIHVAQVGDTLQIVGRQTDNCALISLPESYINGSENKDKVIEYVKSMIQGKNWAII